MGQYHSLLSHTAFTVIIQTIKTAGYPKVPKIKTKWITDDRHCIFNFAKTKGKTKWITDVTYLHQTVGIIQQIQSELTMVVVIGVVFAVVIFVFILYFTFYWVMDKREKKITSLKAGVKPEEPSSGSKVGHDIDIPVKNDVLIPTVVAVPSNNNVVVVPSSTRPDSWGSSCMSFTYEELVKATDNFSQINFLGQGGFGPVHKGLVHGQKHVAVKQLNSMGGAQGEREFQSEIEIISRIHHKHLVSLVGYCIEGNERLLVYEYMENNSLGFHLHGNEARSIDWATRMQIAIGSAKGLAYLHEDCEPKVIHRDIKSTNILLDSNFRAKVSDFGIARCILETDTHVTTRIIGTIGYLAPEYGSTGKLTEKSDVYSFGVVLLELITGRKPVNLVHSVKPLLIEAMRDGIYDQVVDRKLDDDYDPDEMLCMVVSALSCVHHEIEQRPNMFEVARVLDGTMSIEGLKSIVTGRTKGNNRQRKETRRTPAYNFEEDQEGITTTSSTNTTSTKSSFPSTWGTNYSDDNV